MFGCYFSYGAKRDRKIERGDRNITISFWRISVCFARLDIEHLLATLNAHDTAEARSAADAYRKQLEDTTEALVTQEADHADDLSELGSKINVLTAQLEAAEQRVRELEPEKIEELKRKLAEVSDERDRAVEMGDQYEEEADDARDELELLKKQAPHLLALAHDMTKNLKDAFGVK